MFLVESHAIPHLTFGGWGLLIQSQTVESVPDIRYGFGRDLVRGHPDAPMIGLVLRVNQQL